MSCALHELVITSNHSMNFHVRQTLFGYICSQRCHITNYFAWLVNWWVKKLIFPCVGRVSGNVSSECMLIHDACKSCTLHVVGHNLHTVHSMLLDTIYILYTPCCWTQSTYCTLHVVGHNLHTVHSMLLDTIYILYTPCCRTQSTYCTLHVVGHNLHPVHSMLLDTIYILYTPCC